MMRSPVSLRSAAPSDAPALAELWCEVIRRADHVEQVADLRSVIERVTPLHDERIVVADYDGQLAGAVHLRVTTLTPLNLEPVLQAISPHVFPHLRRHGVGRVLIDAAVSFAEERGIGHIATAAVSGSRDANRFLARLGLGPAATLRVAPTLAVRSRLTARQPAAVRTGGRQLTQVLAARRSLRRSQASTTG